MPANQSNTNPVITFLIHTDKTHFQNVVVMLLLRVAKDMTLLLLSWHKRYDFNAANFRHHSQLSFIACVGAKILYDGAIGNDGGDG